MISILVYDPPTGRIKRRVTCPESTVENQVEGGELWMLGDADDALNYIVVDAAGIPTITPRPTMSPRWNNIPLRSNGQDVALLLDLPSLCRVAYEGPGFWHEGEVVGGVAEFTTDVPGPHKVTVSAWPYLDWTEELDAI